MRMVRRTSAHPFRPVSPSACPRASADDGTWDDTNVRDDRCCRSGFRSPSVLTPCPPPRASPARLPARPVAEPERAVAIPVRRARLGGGPRLVSRRPAGAPPDPRALPLGLPAVALARQRRDRLDLPRHHP